MPMLRWFVSLAFLACLWAMFAFPALGMLVSIRPPPPIAVAALNPETSGERQSLGDSYREKSGLLWHLHLVGDAPAIGYAHGALAGDLTMKIEGEMMATFITLVPNFLARHVVLGLVAWNSRTLSRHFSSDELCELSGAVEGSTRFHDSYRAVYPHFSRALNYHALHDISHYLIDNPLINAPQIGCTAVAVGGKRSADGHLLVGRLFDFEGGREFDINKVVMTVRPAVGHPFISVGWAGLTGAVTGLNDAGLWVSINAGASVGEATVGRPIIMVAREILQHCATIDQAVQVLKKSPVFVSDGMLLASAAENRAVAAEIGPTGLAIRDMVDDHLVITNHFESQRWAKDPVNAKRRSEGTTAKRYQRAEALIWATPKHTVSTLLDLLRNRRGVHGDDVGFGNRGTINAWIGAHLVVADVHEKIIYVCEPSHGLGRALAFGIDGPLASDPLPASPDLALHDGSAQVFETLRDKARALIAAGKRREAAVLTRQALGINPGNYEARLLDGLTSDDPKLRRQRFNEALASEPAYPRERRHLQELIQDLGGQ
jgi:hypothetical protein